MGSGSLRPVASILGIPSGQLTLAKSFCWGFGITAESYGLTMLEFSCFLVAPHFNAAFLLSFFCKLKIL